MWLGCVGWPPALGKMLGLKVNRQVYFFVGEYSNEDELLSMPKKTRHLDLGIADHG